MTFLDISIKIFWKNITRYRLYFFCCVCAAAVFFCFAALFTNQSFMEGQAVDPMIADNIIFPSFLAAVFLLLFVPYSYSVFLFARKQEYGILFSLGMSRLAALKCLFLEGAAMGGLALVLSFLAGSILSLFFSGVISRVIGIEGLQWEISYKAYAVTALLYGTALGITAVLGGISTLGGRIRSLLLAPYQAEAKGGGYHILQKYFPGYAKKRLVECSLLARHRKDWTIRYVFSALLIGTVLHLAGFCLVLQSSLLRDVENYCPYDLAYSEMLGKNHISEDELRDTLSLHGVTIVKEKKISYVRDAAFNYLAVSEVNEKLGCSYRVLEGTFLNLFQYEMEDGYEHDIQEIPRVSLSLETGGELKLFTCGSDIRILFNKGPAQADYTLILNDADFDRIKSDPNYWFGMMHLFQLQDFKTSFAGIKSFQSLLQEVNGLTVEEQQYFRAVSKIERLWEARQSGQFCIFLMFFVEALLLMAAYLLIHVRVAAEREENKRAFTSLFLVGITDEEAFRLCLFKNRMRFLPPLIAALIFSMPLLYTMGEGSYHSGALGCFGGICIDFFLVVFTSISSVFYSRRELKFLKM